LFSFFSTLAMHLDRACEAARSLPLAIPRWHAAKPGGYTGQIHAEMDDWRGRLNSYAGAEARWTDRLLFCDGEGNVVGTMNP